MARFIFSMQNILNMKEKLEEQAKNNFAAGEPFPSGGTAYAKTV